MSHADLTKRPIVGFIGLGNMGSGMSRNLQESGFRLVVTDLRREAAESLLAGGAEWADTAAEVARRSDVVITMLPTPRIVSAALHGENGILAGLSAGKTWIDMSTSVPEVADGVREEAEARGIRVVDAPVSGMSVGAASGMLQIFVGADPEVFAELLPVFEAMGDPERIINVGGHGAGYAVKLMINQLWFSHLVATAEVLAIGTAAGVDLDVLRRSLIASPANSNFLERDVLSILEHGDYDEGFAIALACKDLGLSSDLARSVGVPSELSALVEQVFRRARRSYGDRAGEMTPFKLYEDLLGTELRLGAGASSGEGSATVAEGVAA
ncbi:NAD(P)-dependent oxidoreductase [Leucobacter ruminantium]|uniref:NAD(P)-dependent oxidoreductase n=1 Tax=Leucobacter ruminantium TaxID=1289170 RepID=A0A939LVN9_9MICO|nr:NAD(P)-dependent oxidoreductase [Leucobacter ruminantium]MBO1804976.1 NAD(P)-dependent oxidoreductase [Leucobacter ruminantium]